MKRSERSPGGGRRSAESAVYKQVHEDFEHRRTPPGDRAVVFRAFLIGGVLASTWIGRTLGHAEEAAILVKPGCTLLVANDDNYALAA